MASLTNVEEYILARTTWSTISKELSQLTLRIKELERLLVEEDLPQLEGRVHSATYKSLQAKLVKQNTESDLPWNN